MDSEIRPQINKVCRLVSDIARVGSLEPPRSVRNFEDQENSSSLATTALAVSPPDTIDGQIIRLVVRDAQAKEDLASRLHDTKLNLLELCDRQLEDLMAAVGPTRTSREVEDADKLFSEMTGVYHCMEAIAGIERALFQS